MHARRLPGPPHQLQLVKRLKKLLAGCCETHLFIPAFQRLLVLLQIGIAGFCLAAQDIRQQHGGIFLQVHLQLSRLLTSLVPSRMCFLRTMAASERVPRVFTLAILAFGPNGRCLKRLPQARILGVHARISDYMPMQIIQIQEALALSAARLRYMLNIPVFRFHFVLGCESSAMKARVCSLRILIILFSLSLLDLLELQLLRLNK